MSYTQSGRSVGYSNLASGSAAGAENHCGAGNPGPAVPTYNISVGHAEPKGTEKMTPGVSAPTWHK